MVETEAYIKPEPNKQNYQKLLDTIIEENAGCRPRLLLHSCCAPCSSAVLDYLSKYFQITLFYYNPNISTEAEFQHRVSELQRLIREMHLVEKGVSILVPPYDHKEFLEIARGHEKDPERGERCHRCYRERLERTAEEMDRAKAAGEPYDYFCTTLTISPMKSAEILNEIGSEIASQHALRFLPSDFKKRGGYQKSIELSRQYQLYRQDFCGCEFSKAASERERRAREQSKEKVMRAAFLDKETDGN